MKLKICLVVLCLALMLPLITSCGAKKQAKDQGKTAAPAASETVVAQAPPQPAQLPVRYQSPGYITADGATEEKLIEGSDEYQIKVGATIRSAGGPQPLWDVMKRLANLKGMTVSWASDVDRTIPVDVDIAANDNFFDAVANLLRQADYYHEVKGKTIVVLNKETRVYQIGVPAMKGAYTSTVGGNFLANRDAATGTEGTVKINSADNKFDIWENIEKNLNVILRTTNTGKGSAEKNASTEKNAPPASGTKAYADQKGAANTTTAAAKGKDDKNTDNKAEYSEMAQQAHRQTAEDEASFVIDKSVGLVTVTAKPVLLKNVDNYIDNLKKHLYRQVAIEAKVIEVFLQDNSKIGLDWSTILKDFPISGTATFGANGQVYPWTDATTSFVSKITLNPASFTLLLNALNEQGDSHVLANPKLTVLNGQPAIISVGKDVAYVKTVTKDIDSDTNETTYTAEVDNVVQGIALGVMPSILDNKKVILHLTPLTTDIENLDANGNIPMTSIGDGAIELGLPQVKVREMSTMVEVEDGEMLIIGGLIDNTEGKSENFAPVVGSIPILKYLFGVEEKVMKKRELVILLTPRII